MLFFLILSPLHVLIPQMNTYRGRKEIKMNISNLVLFVIFPIPIYFFIIVCLLEVILSLLGLEYDLLKKIGLEGFLLIVPAFSTISGIFLIIIDIIITAH